MNQSRLRHFCWVTLRENASDWENEGTNYGSPPWRKIYSIERALLDAHRESPRIGDLRHVLKKTTSGLFLQRSPSMKYPFCRSIHLQVGIRNSSRKTPVLPLTAKSALHTGLVLRTVFNSGSVVVTVKRAEQQAWVVIIRHGRNQNVPSIDDFVSPIGAMEVI